MSEDRPDRRIRDVLAKRWQMPLLGLSLILLMAAVVRLMPKQQPPSVEDKLARLHTLRAGGYAGEAINQAKLLFDDETLTDRDKARVNLFIARTIWQAHHRAARPDRAVGTALLSRQSAAVDGGASLGADDYRQAGWALALLGMKRQAIGCYHKALDEGFTPEAPLRRRIANLSKDQQEAEEQIDRILALPSPDEDDLLWAVQRKADLMLAEQDAAAVREFLQQVCPRLAAPRSELEWLFLDAQALVKAGQLDEADRVLRSLRDRLTVRDDLDAKSGWLLGYLNYRDGRPQEALSFFNDVVSTHRSGEYYHASVLGRAQCLAELYRLDEAIAEYRRVIQQVPHHPNSRLAGREVVRAGLMQRCAILQRAGRLDDALRFCRLAASLVTENEEVLRAADARRLGKLCAELAREAAALGDAERASTRLAEAAEHYLTLSRLTTLNEPVSAEAMWQAANYYDLAGERDKAIGVMESFVEGRPNASKTPEALFRLGQAYQAEGEPAKAIQRYLECNARFPRTPAAFASLVPLAKCLLAVSPPREDEAETVLLRVVEQDPHKPPLYDPRAREFRDAVFALGKLYARRGRYEQAISRLEDALGLYPNDPRATSATFWLADAYRKSGLALRGELGKTVSGPALRAGQEEVTRRLTRAAELFDAVVAAGEAPRSGQPSPIERLYLEHSYLYRGDCLFDLGRYAEAIERYEQAVSALQRGTGCLSACVQIVHSYLRLGRPDAARATVERIRWLLRKLPDEAFVATGALSRQQWRQTLGWLEESGLF